MAAITKQYPFAVRDFGNSNYGNPIAVARIATGMSERSFRILNDRVVRYAIPDGADEVSFVYTDDTLAEVKREVRELYAALGWPTPQHNMMAGEQWTWLVIKHVRGLIS